MLRLINCGRRYDNILIECRWRNVKYEEVL